VKEAGMNVNTMPDVVEGHNYEVKTRAFSNKGEQEQN
jgi:hypothetical protein